MIVKDCILLDRFLTSYKRIMIQLLENSLFKFLLSSFFLYVSNLYIFNHQNLKSLLGTRKVVNKQHNLVLTKYDDLCNKYFD